jgi:hypothetical protein
MCTGSDLNPAGFVRLQRRVGQEVAASLLTVLAFAHHHHPTAVVVRGRNALAKGPGSMPPLVISPLVGMGAHRSTPSVQQPARESAIEPPAWLTVDPDAVRTGD